MASEQPHIQQPTEPQQQSSSSSEKNSLRDGIVRTGCAGIEAGIEE